MNKLPPELTIIDLSLGRARCHFTPSKLIGENWVGVIIGNTNKFIWGRFSSIEEIDRTCDFIFDTAIESSYLDLNNIYPYLDGYYGERAIFAYSDPRKWHKTIFRKSDAVKIPGGWRQIKPDEEVSADMLIVDGWDHEHCKVCWSKIDEKRPNCFFNNIDYLCEDCFSNIVIKKDFGFIDS